MSRILASPKRHTSNSTHHSTITKVWSKQSYESHRKHYDSYNPKLQTEFMFGTINTQSDNSSTIPNQTSSNPQHPIAKANNISQLLQIDLIKINQQ